MNFTCLSGEKTDIDIDNKDNEEDNDDIWAKPKVTKVQEEIKEDVALETNEEEKVLNEVGYDEKPKESESIYEPVGNNNEKADECLSVEENITTEDVVERTPTPDPLKRLAAQLQGQLIGYKEDLNQFSDIMDRHRPTEEVPEENSNLPETSTTASSNISVERKLSSQEEVAMVRKMSSEDAWSHVINSVYEVRSIT